MTKKDKSLKNIKKRYNKQFLFLYNLYNFKADINREHKLRRHTHKKINYVKTFNKFDICNVNNNKRYGITILIMNNL